MESGTFWSAGQRCGHSLHEISYRACFKPALAAYFIEQFSKPGEVVFDPFILNPAVEVPNFCKRPYFLSSFQLLRSSAIRKIHVFRFAMGNICLTKMPRGKLPI